jgi:hypothetical protein
LAFLRAIDATEAGAFRVVVVQNFYSVAVEDRDDGAGGSYVEGTTTEIGRASMTVQEGSS